MIPRTFQQRLLGFAFTAGPLLLMTSSPAQTIIWQGGGDWATPGNWNPAGPPDTGDEVLFGDLGAGTVALDGAISVVSITIDSDSDYTFNGSGVNFIGGGTTITKSGNGLLILGGTNTFTGGLSITGGTLRPSGSQALGANGSVITVGPGATFDVGGQMAANRDYHIRISGTGVGGNGAVVNSGGENQHSFGRLTLDADASIGGSGRWDVRGAGGNNGSYSGLLDLNGHTLTKIGGNKVSIVDANAIADGGIEINSGVLAFTRSHISGAGSISVNSGGTLQFENYNATSIVDKAITLNGGILESSGNAVILASHISLAANSQILAGSALTLSGSIEGTGSLAKTGGGNLIVTGNATHSGGTTVSTGTLQIGNGGSTGSIAGDIVNNATVAFNRSNEHSYGGSISGTGGLTKSGAGVLTLTGPNTYGGDTTISAGALSIEDTGSLPGWNVNGRYTVASGATLGVGNAVSDADLAVMLGTTNYASGSHVGFDTSAGNRTYANSLSGALGLAKIGDNTLTLTNAQAYTGNTRVFGGTLRIAGGNNTLQTGTIVNFSNVAGAVFDLNGLNQEVRGLVGGGGAGGDVANSGAGTSVLTIRPGGTDNTEFAGRISGDVRVEIVGNKTSPAFSAPRQRFQGTDHTFAGGLVIDGGTLLARADGSLGAVPESFQADNIILRNNGTLFNETGGDVFLLTVHQNRGITLGAGGGGMSAGFDRNVTIQGVISGDAGNDLTVLGNSGTVIFTGANTYAGTTRLVAGDSRLQIGNGGGSGSLGTGNVVNNGLLVFDRSGSLNAENHISGSGVVRNLGAGDVTLSGNLSVASVQANGGGNLTISGTISGGGSVVKNDTGVLTLSGNNTYTGTTNVNSGVIAAASNEAFGASTIRLDGGNISSSDATAREFTTGKALDFAVTSFFGTTGTGDLKFNDNVNLGNAAKAANVAEGVLVEFAGQLSGGMENPFTKGGEGVLLLSGASASYQRSTIISAGTLLVTGQLGGTGTVAVMEGATLGGDGEISGLVATAGAGAIISPGTSPGEITFGGLDVTNGGTFLFELGDDSDLIVITGGLTAGGPLNFHFSDAGGLIEQTAYTLFAFGSETGLDYGDLSAVTLPGGLQLDSTFGTGGWQINSGSLQVQFIPEPSSALLGGLGMLLVFRRRRN